MGVFARLVGGRLNAMARISIHWSKEERAYGGGELRSHFLLDAFGIFGDVAAAFVGPCRVEKETMVDLEDLRRGDFIYSPRMLHFLVEHFDLGLREGVIRQRLLARLAADELLERGLCPRVRGDDLYLDQRKASVSIATRSPVSVLIHLGINVRTEGVPVPAWGLEETTIEPEVLARKVLGRYQEEIDDIYRSVAKVRATS